MNTWRSVRKWCGLRGAAGLAVALALLQPVPTPAYVGPGAGLSLLGSLIGLLVAIVTAMAVVLWWPLRLLIRKLRRSRREPDPPVKASD